MKRHFAASMLGLAAAVGFSEEASATAYCTGPVYDVNIRLDGRVIANWGFGDVALCNLQQDFVLGAPNNLTVKPATCQGIYSRLLSTKLSNGEIVVAVVESGCSGFVSSGNITKTIIYISFAQ